MNKQIVEIYTDGACSGNPGPGGWGAVLRYSGQEKEISGGEPDTTNNRMELLAAIKALETRRVLKIRISGKRWMNYCKSMMFLSIGSVVMMVIRKMNEPISWQQAL